MRRFRRRLPPDSGAGERRLKRLMNAPAWAQVLAFAYIISLLLFFHAVKAHEFIYFQF